MFPRMASPVGAAMPEEVDLDEQIGRARARKEPVFFIVDRDGRIVFDSQENSVEMLLAFCPDPGCLRSDLCSILKGMIESDPAKNGAAHFAFVAPGHVMRLRRLTGPGQQLFAVILEPFRSRDTVRVAARRYALTKREHEILMLILEGASASEMSAALNLSEHTVQGYFKRLLKKTGARNRAAMVANVLEWSRTNAGASDSGKKAAICDHDDGDEDRK